MVARKELKGKTIGFLKVLGKVRRVKGKPLKWRCVCVCGKRLTVPHYRLVHDHPKTHCGCKLKGPPSKYPSTYASWYSMLQRCLDTNSVSYAAYGAKGITVCKRWHKKEDGGEGFEGFLEDIGPKPTKKHTLDRINPYGNYEPENVRWATPKEQTRNRKITKMVKHPKTGKIVPAGQAAEEMKMTYNSFRYFMIKRGEW